MRMQPQTSMRCGRRRTGFSIPEVIVGAMILGIGLATILAATSRALNNQTRGERMQVASWLADELLTMVLVEGPETYLTGRSSEGAFDGEFADFTYEIAIERVNEHEPFRVAVAVGWPPYDLSSLVEVRTWVAVRRGEEEEPVPRIPPEPIDRFERYYEDAQ